jgi:hypothetical protein
VSVLVSKLLNTERFSPTPHSACHVYFIADMQRPPQVERALYVPKGRREMLAGNGEQNGATSKKRHPREEAASDDTAVKSKSNSRASSSSPPDQPVSEAVPPTTVPGSVTAVTAARRTELYIPRGRRGLNEQNAQSAPTGVASDVNPATNVKTLVAPNPQVPVKGQGSAKASATTTSVETIPLSGLALNNNGNPTAPADPKPKESSWGIYVPKGRRELNEKKALEPPVNDPPTSSSRLSKESRHAANADNGGDDGERLPLPPKAKLSAYTKWDDSSEEDDEDNERGGSTTKSSTPAPPSQDETIGDSCLLLSGVPAELSDAARSNITRPYLEKGATVRWLGATECLIAFKSDRAATGAVPPVGASIFRTVRLRDVPLPARTAHVEGMHFLAIVVTITRKSRTALIARCSCPEQLQRCGTCSRRSSRSGTRP